MDLYKQLHFENFPEIEHTRRNNRSKSSIRYTLPHDTPQKQRFHSAPVPFSPLTREKLEDQGPAEGRSDITVTTHLPPHITEDTPQSSALSIQSASLPLRSIRTASEDSLTPNWNDDAISPTQLSVGRSSSIDPATTPASTVLDNV